MNSLEGGYLPSFFNFKSEMFVKALSVSRLNLDSREQNAVVHNEEQ